MKEPFHLTACPDDEHLAAYCDRRLRDDERVAVETHLADCASCRAVVVETARSLLASQEAAPTPKPAPVWQKTTWPLAAAAAAVLAVGGALMFAPGGRFGRDAGGERGAALQSLAAALAAEPARPVTGRLSVGPYAPAPLPQRGSSVEPSPDVRIASARIEKLGRGENSPADAAALGVAYLAVGSLDRAVEALEEATANNTATASAQSDLAAAYLARAAWQARPEDWTKALAVAERSISADPSFTPAYFNRALALSGLALTDRATQAWEAYLARDPSSEWAREARERLDVLRRRGANGWRDLQRLREQVENELIPAWAAATVAGRTGDAEAALRLAASAADALAAEGGDSMARDEIALIQRRGATGQRSAVLAIAKGQIDLQRARRAFAEERLADAAEVSAGAAASLRQVGSAYAWWDRIYQAVATRARGAPATALQVLRDVPDDTFPPTYFHLRGRTAWMRGASNASLGRYDRARDEHLRALELFRLGHEDEHLSATRTHLAEAEWALGEQRTAWQHQIEATAGVDRLPVGTRRNVILFTGAYFCSASGLPEAALHFQTALVDSLSSTATGSALSDALMQRAEIYGELGQADKARADLRAAGDALGDGLDPGLRARSRAEIQRVAARIALALDPGTTVRESTMTLAYFRDSGSAARVSELYLLRARAHEALRDLAEAHLDFERAASAFEGARRQVSSPEDRLRAFADQRGAYRAWTDFCLRRQASAGALRIWERGLALRVRGAPAGMQGGGLDPELARLSFPPDLAVVYFVVLDARLVSWVLTKERVERYEHAVSRAALVATVDAVTRAIESGATAPQVREKATRLLRDYVGPAARAALAKRSVVVIPDGVLWRVPFASLLLLADLARADYHAIVVASGLTNYLELSDALGAAPLRSVLAVGDGYRQSERPLPRLEGSDSEVAQIGRLYPRSVVLTGERATEGNMRRQSADVFHFAGHTLINRTDPLDSRLMLAAELDGDASFDGRDMLTRPLPGVRVAVLGSCESSAGPVVDGDGVLGPASLFLAGGVGAVIASALPVDDRSTPFLLDVHKRLLRGHDPAAALLGAQGQALQAGGATIPVRVWATFAAFGGTALAGGQRRGA